MAKIPLTITEDYAPHWGIWEGLREIIQNAADADDEGYTMSVEHSPRSNTLTITNKGVKLNHRVLLLGGTDGKGVEARGRHRDGMKISLLALSRAGCEVTIYNGEEVWRAGIEPWDIAKIGERSGGDEINSTIANVLVIHTRKLRIPREDYSVEVTNISKDVWKEVKKRFLFLGKQAPEDVITVRGRKATVLLSPDYKGAVFCRGIYVCTVPDLEAGYDLHYLTLDRDRGVVNAWDLKLELAQLWNCAIQDNPERTAARVYKMVKANAAETSGLRHWADADLAAKIRKQLHEEHGEDAVPVSTNTEAAEVESIGMRPILVSADFKEILEKDGTTVDTLRKKYQRSIVARHVPSALSDRERGMLSFLHPFLEQDSYIVVDFADASVVAQHIVDENLVALSRTALTVEDVRQLVDKVIREEATRRGTDPLTISVEGIAALREKGML